MDKQKAIELLKQGLYEIDHLRKLNYDNQSYKLWRDKIKDILDNSFGNKSIEYERFAGASVHVLPYYQKEYIEELEMRETALKSIIQKHEIIGFEEKESISVAPEEIIKIVSPKAFISHGKESVALRKLKEFIETLGIEPLIVKKLASIDKDVPEKINLYLSQADFVIILATADDIVIDQTTGEKKKQPRQNVIHEIGLAQKIHPGKIIYLLETGAEFPSNIRPKVWESFKQRNMMDSFLGILRELRAYGILSVTKYPITGVKS